MDNTLAFTLNDGRVITVMAKYVTPAEAKDMLARNKRNRPLNRKRVDQLVADITDGVFKFNGDTVRLASEDGYNDLLLDAQHRLEACVESDTAIPLLIVQNLDPDVSDTIDQGKARTVADILRLQYGHEVSNSTTLSAAALLMWVGEGRGLNPTRPVLAQYINANLDDFAEWSAASMYISDQSSTVPLGNRLVKAMAPSPLATLMLYMVRQGANPLVVNDFFTRIATGVVDGDDRSNVIPAIRRRQSNGLPLNRLGGGSAFPTLFAEYWVYITSYGRWMEGQPIQAIRGPQKEIRSFADLPPVWHVERDS